MWQPQWAPWDPVIRCVGEIDGSRGGDRATAETRSCRDAGDRPRLLLAVVILVPSANVGSSSAGFDGEGHPLDHAQCGGQATVDGGGTDDVQWCVGIALVDADPVVGDVDEEDIRVDGRLLLVCRSSPWSSMSVPAT